MTKLMSAFGIPPESPMGARNVKTALLSILLVSAAVGCLPGPVLAQDTTGTAIDASYVVRVTPPPNAHKVRARIPLPSSDQFQMISQLQLKAPGAVGIRKESKVGDRYAYLTVDTSRIHGPFEIRVMFRVYRSERRPNLAAATASPGSYPNDVAEFLQTDAPAPGGQAIMQLAHAQTENLSDPLQKSRAIYDFVISRRAESGSSEKSAEGMPSCHSYDRDCADANTLFVEMTRAVGIPARLQVGFVLPQGQKEGTIARARTWAEFFIAGIGWVPVDASASDPESRSFGALDGHRVMISAGPGIASYASDNGGLSALAYPSVVIDGVPCINDLTTDFFFHETGFTSTSAFKKTIFAANRPAAAGARIFFSS